MEEFMKYYLTSKKDDPFASALVSQKKALPKQVQTLKKPTESEITSKLSTLVREDRNALIVFSSELTEFIQNTDGLYDRLVNILVLKEHRGIIRTVKGTHMCLHTYVA